METIKTESAFLNKIQKQIAKGIYDEYVTPNRPFVTKNLLFKTIKQMFDEKHKECGALFLTEEEIKYAIETTKVTASEICVLFIKHGILEPTIEGYQLSRKAKIALRTLNY